MLIKNDKYIENFLSRDEKKRVLLDLLTCNHRNDLLKMVTKFEKQTYSIDEDC